MRAYEDVVKAVPKIKIRWSKNCGSCRVAIPFIHCPAISQRNPSLNVVHVYVLPIAELEQEFHFSPAFTRGGFIALNPIRMSANFHTRAGAQSIIVLIQHIHVLGACLANFVRHSFQPDFNFIPIRQSIKRRQPWKFLHRFREELTRNRKVIVNRFHKICQRIFWQRI